MAIYSIRLSAWPRWLKIPVIAEGVETKQQADFMRDIGCYCVQGYYYSKPIGVEEYEALMNSI